jgi:hypothetical protein
MSKQITTSNLIHELRDCFEGHTHLQDKDIRLLYLRDCKEKFKQSLCDENIRERAILAAVDLLSEAIIFDMRTHAKKWKILQIIKNMTSGFVHFFQKKRRQSISKS